MSDGQNDLYYKELMKEMEEKPCDHIIRCARCGRKVELQVQTKLVVVDDS